MWSYRSGIYNHALTISSTTALCWCSIAWPRLKPSTLVGRDLPTSATIMVIWFFVCFLICYLSFYSSFFSSIIATCISWWSSGFTQSAQDSIFNKSIIVMLEIFFFLITLYSLNQVEINIMFYKPNFFYIKIL